MLGAGGYCPCCLGHGGGGGDGGGGSAPLAFYDACRRYAAVARRVAVGEARWERLEQRDGVELRRALGIWRTFAQVADARAAPGMPPSLSIRRYALMNLATAYIHGRGVPIDMEEAGRLFEVIAFEDAAKATA